MSEMYIKFVLAEKQNPKTKVWDIVTNDFNEDILGQVRWYGPWRCYSFCPDREAKTFEKKCLRDIATFCENETKKHRERSKK